MLRQKIKDELNSNKQVIKELSTELNQVSIENESIRNEITSLRQTLSNQELVRTNKNIKQI